MFSCVCIKMSKTLSAKYYQESKERLRYQNLSKEDKKKSSYMVMNISKIFKRMKNKKACSAFKKILQNEKNTLLSKVMTHKVPFKSIHRKR